MRVPFNDFDQQGRHEMLRISNLEFTKILLSKALEKLPSTRGGEGYYIEDTRRVIYILDLIADLYRVDVLGWGPFKEYEPVVGDVKRYKIAEAIIDYHMLGLRRVLGGRRLAKDAKELFVNNLIADFQMYGLFDQQRKGLVCKVARILAG